MADRGPRTRRTRTVLAAVLGGLLAVGVGWLALRADDRSPDPLPRSPATAAGSKAPARAREASPALREEPPAPRGAPVASAPGLAPTPRGDRELRLDPAFAARTRPTRWRGTLILRDSTTGLEIQGATSGIIETTVSRGNTSAGRFVYPQGKGGSIRLYTDEPRRMTVSVGMTAGDEATAAAPASTEDRGWVDIRLPGYAAKRVPHPEDGAEVEVLLEPWTACVRGVVEVRGDDRAEVAFRLIGPGDPSRGVPRIDGSGGHPGPFEVYDLPAGDYDLVVQAQTASATTWARRRIEYRGVLLDLGVVPVDGAAGFRARKLDADGLPLSDTLLGASLVQGENGILTSGSPFQSAVDVSVSARPVAGGDGWVELAGLLPGGRYKVSSKEAIPVFAEAVAPEENGAFTDITLVRTVRPVHCTLRFTLKGKAPAYWEVVNSPFPEEGWTAPGRYEGDLHPGKYAVGLRVNAVEKDPGHASWVQIEVPEGGPFDRTYDL